MANPFKDAEKRKKVAPGGEKSQEETTQKAKPVVKETSDPVKKDNPLEGLVEQKERDGKSHGFYLSAEAAEKLEKLAKQNKCSKSKALDTLLRNL